MATLLNQSAVPINFRVVKGNTLEFIVTLKEGGAPIDVSAFLFSFEVLHHRTKQSLFTLTLGDGIEFEIALGKVRVTVTATQTGGLPVASNIYQFKFEKPGGYTRTPFAGYLSLDGVGQNCVNAGCDTPELVFDTTLTELCFDLGDGIPGPPGVGVPVGGTIGQYLVKTGNPDYAAGWTSVLPGGGTDLSTVPTCFDDVDAINNFSLGSGDFYWVAYDSDAYPPGSLRKIP